MKHAHARFILCLLVLLAAARGNAQQTTDRPATAKQAAAKLSEREVSARYQAWVAGLSPAEQAWERLLQENLGSFYLPIHQREKINGVSNAWDFIKDDPKLPRVLLIGDSISRGYTQPCRKALAGKANVHRAPANCGPTTLGLEKLDVWLGDGKWDLIYFNFGAHDHIRASPIPEYSQRLEQIVERLQRTGAKLVWASTVPRPSTASGKAGAAPVADYNAAAAEIMLQHHVSIDDLYTAITPHVAAMQLKDGHFRAEGNEFLGKHAAAFIEKALK